MSHDPAEIERLVAQLHDMADTLDTDGYMTLPVIAKQAAAALLAEKRRADEARTAGWIAGMEDAKQIAESYVRAYDAQKAIDAALAAGKEGK